MAYIYIKTIFYTPSILLAYHSYNSINTVKRAITIITLIGLLLTVAGIYLVIMSGSPAPSMPLRLLQITVGLAATFLGTHLTIVGLDSLRGLEKRLKGGRGG